MIPESNMFLNLAVASSQYCLKIILDVFDTLNLGKAEGPLFTTTEAKMVYECVI